MISKILCVALALFCVPTATSDIKPSASFYPTFPETITMIPAEEKPADPAVLTHAQEIWISALEWCESSGDPTAVNPMDSDGTPSYYSYSFKPATFKGLGEQYGIIDKGQSDIAIMSLMKDNALQRAIVRRMIKDKDIDIATQFPGCVRKLGYPPRY